MIVKAQYFLNIEPEESKLRRIQQELTKILQQLGYQQTDVDPNPFGPAQRTMDFRYTQIPTDDSSSLLEKLKGLFPSDSERKRVIDHDEFLYGLSRLTDQTPFRLVFYFQTFETEEMKGYDVSIESTPVLLQKYRQLDMPEDYSYNIKDVVSQNKREIKRIMGRFGLDPVREPYTEEEVLDTRLAQEFRENLASTDYGRTALRYLDEGDTCFQQNLLHASLSCYILSIEWTIIAYLEREREVDIIEEQKQDEDTRYYFWMLIDKIEGDSPVSQKTLDSLNQYSNAERHWIAHHKSGEIPETRVEDVRETLLNLIGELFENSLSETDSSD